MEVVDAAFNNISAAIGFPVDQLKFVFCLICNYPAALIFRNLPRDAVAIKHIFSIVLSITYMWFCLGPTAWIHSFVSSTVTYLIVKYVPHGLAHKVAFVWVLGYMSASHLYRQYVDYMGWTLDFTTMQMVLTLRLTSFAFNYYDGHRDEKDVTEDQKRRCIKTLPGLLEFYGFVYFFCSFLAGPAIEFWEYRNYMDYSMFNDKFCNGNIPSSGWPAVKVMLTSLIFLPLDVLGGIYPVKWFISPEGYSASWVEKIFKMLFIPTLVRMKYYFGWYFSEGACILLGIGYNGLDKHGHPTWNRVSNVEVLKMEFAENMRGVTTYWNMRTADWLKNYVYLRLTPPGARPTMAATVTTYAISAFWHGFYPGYYLFFLISAVYTEIAKDARNIIRPHMLNKGPIVKTIYDYFGMVLTIWFMNYAGCSFSLLSWERAMLVYNHWLWMPHILAISTLILFRTVLKQKKPKKEKEHHNKKE